MHMIFPAGCARLMPAILLVGAVLTIPGQAEQVQFNRDIRPILSNHCFTCHGPDASHREAELRFDLEEEAKADRGGYHALLPGKPDESELLLRILEADEHLRMPPPEAGDPLSEREIDLLRRWIEQGSEWSPHWSFVPPARPELPAERESPHPVDAFVQQRLAAEGIDPAPPADKEVQIRRATLTLTGLPPTPAEVDAFLADDTAEAFERVLDRLLASPRYGERMAYFWMEAARYADTDGYQIDTERTMWPWRDWVIKAYNDNMPFDRFTIEQLAGDMLPQATNHQRLASAFNRNHRLNSEGGAIPEEFIVEYAVDRVETTGTVWLGLTIGCARCHDHKFDPVSQREFFELYAYFNNIPERGTGRGNSAPPIVSFASPLAEIPEELLARRTAAEAAMKQAEAQLAEARRAWEPTALAGIEQRGLAWSDAKIVSAAAQRGGTLEPQEDGSLLAAGDNPATQQYVVELEPDAASVTAVRLDVLADPSFTQPVGFARSTNGNFVLTGFRAELFAPGRPPHTIELRGAEASYSQPDYDISGSIDGNNGTGWGAHGRPDDRAEKLSAMFVFDRPEETPAGARLRITLEHNSRFARHQIGRFRLSLSEHPAPLLDSDGGDLAAVIEALSVPADERTAAQRNTIRAHYRTIDPQWTAARAELADVERLIERTAGPTVPVMIMQENARRNPTYLLRLGQYDMPDKSEELSPGVPAALAGGGDSQRPGDRLELARWIVSPENPLTARVVVNRLWQQHFGVGLVKTSEDFGLQGEWPSHPELLDWLAVEFVESGWDIQHMHRVILSSHAFRQESRTGPELQARDPENRLLARGPRFRLDGSAIRDTALAASGLLHEKRGGPPVRPYQPDDLWTSLDSSGRRNTYAQSSGSDLYRRSLYTFWRRTVGPPTLVLFDAAEREMCNVRVHVTNTPLQALALMNETGFVEAARGLGERMMRHAAADSDPVSARLAHGYRLATGYRVAPERLEVLQGNFDFFRGHFREHPSAAEAFLRVGESRPDAALDPLELAAYAATAHLILNLDETISLE